MLKNYWRSRSITLMIEGPFLCKVLCKITGGQLRTEGGARHVFVQKVLSSVGVIASA
nr:hypothetical protein Iba_scaffold35282CG0010 [Ipomoea batatas]GME20481.1 hypothetical protein Iba_scaffold25242CG0010 [Ipomoea batatas]